MLDFLEKRGMGLENDMFDDAVDKEYTVIIITEVPLQCQTIVGKIDTPNYCAHPPPAPLLG